MKTLLLALQILVTLSLTSPAFAQDGDISKRVHAVIEKIKQLDNKDYLELNNATRGEIRGIFDETRDLIFKVIPQSNLADAEKRGLASSLGKAIGEILNRTGEVYEDGIRPPTDDRDFGTMNFFQKSLAWAGWGLSTLFRDFVSMVIPGGIKSFSLFGFVNIPLLEAPHAMPLIGPDSQRTALLEHGLKEMKEASEEFLKIQGSLSNSDAPQAEFLRGMVEEAGKFEPLYYRNTHRISRAIWLAVGIFLAINPPEFTLHPTFDSPAWFAAFWFGSALLMRHARRNNSGVVAGNYLKQIIDNLGLSASEIKRSNRKFIVASPRATSASISLSAGQMASAGMQVLNSYLGFSGEKPDFINNCAAQF